jgi:hypothetical protein
MLIPFTQAAQTLAELHEIFVWRCHAEWSLKGSHRRFTTIKSNNLYQGDKHFHLFNCIMTFSALFAVSAVNCYRSMSVTGRSWFVVEKKSLNPDKPEITNYKHQITNKSQIPIPNDRNIGLKF